MIGLFLASFGSRDAGFSFRDIASASLCKSKDELSILRQNFSWASISVRVSVRVVSGQKFTLTSLASIKLKYANSGPLQLTLPVSEVLLSKS